MTRHYRSALAVTAMFVAGVSAAHAQDAARNVSDGGITAPGWTGVVDAREAERGALLTNARFVSEGGAFHITTGPAVTYWNPANTASGDYTVSATFTESEYMNLNDHPHPYGIVIGGSDLGTEQQSLLYCAAYGTGTFIVRGFGPAPFQVSGRRPEANDAINKAAGKGESVTQQIAVSVRGDNVECAINGVVVGSYPKAEIVADGRLKSTDGIYGIRAAHNTEVVVTNFTMTKN